MTNKNNLKQNLYELCTVDKNTTHDRNSHIITVRSVTANSISGNSWKSYVNHQCVLHSKLCFWCTSSWPLRMIESIDISACCTSEISHATQSWSLKFTYDDNISLEVCRIKFTSQFTFRIHTEYTMKIVALSLVVCVLAVSIYYVVLHSVGFLCSIWYLPFGIWFFNVLRLEQTTQKRQRYARPD